MRIQSNGWAAICGVVGLASLCVLGIAYAQAGVFKSNTKDILDGFTVNVPCANGGLGEDIVFTGSLHSLVSGTVNSNGEIRAKLHFQPQGVSGAGQATGDKYQATGVTQVTDVIGKVGQETTFVNNFRMIGQGPGNNFQVHEVFHFTVNANGEVTSSFDHSSVGCN